jgi:hypothetical protein
VLKEWTWIKNDNVSWMVDMDRGRVIDTVSVRDFLCDHDNAPLWSDEPGEPLADCILKVTPARAKIHHRGSDCWAR